jgi:hypothetical protein
MRLSKQHSTLFILLSFLLANTTIAQTFYVSPTGNDANAGTSSATAWQTVQKACNTATAGSTVLIKAGTYTESLIMNVTGTSGMPITFTTSPNESVIIDGGGVDGGVNAPTTLLNIMNKSYINIVGIKFRNAMGNYSVGIIISGTSNNITIDRDTIENIHFSTNSADPVSFGFNTNPFLVKGDNPTTPITDITIQNCLIKTSRTGTSEALSLSGNVDGFSVLNNTVRNISNIGIDIAGHWSACYACVPTSLNQARNGKVAGNLVYFCRSSYRISAGIYVDGGRDVIIERNTVYQCGRGISIGCENVGKSSSNIAVRDNVIYKNDQSGISLGTDGYPNYNGKAENCTITNNSCYSNGTNLGDYYGEISISYSENCTVKNNIFYADNVYNRIWTSFPNTQPIGLVMDYNLWYTTGGSPTVSLPGVACSGLPDCSAQTMRETHSVFGNPNYVSIATPNLHINSGSAAINIGDPAFVLGAGETDFDGSTRVLQTRVDAGAFELLGPLPIELIKFNGHINTETQLAVLDWQTATEKNNAQFEILRSNNGIDFYKIGSVKGAGTSNTINTYTYTDIDPFNGIRYYKLRQVDFNGTTTTSQTISLENKSEVTTATSIYPNPAQNQLFIENATNQPINIYNAMGQSIYSTNNFQENSIPIQHLPNGIYFLKTNGQVLKFVKN